jgi:hypothetical protein
VVSVLQTGIFRKHSKQGLNTATRLGIQRLSAAGLALRSAPGISTSKDPETSASIVREKTFNLYVDVPLT